MSDRAKFALAMATAVLAPSVLLATAHRVALDRADGAGVLFVVEDAGAEERRADSITLVRWSRACDSVTLTSIPRDLIGLPRSEPLAVLYDTIGLRRFTGAVEDLLHARITAVVTVDVGGVERLAEALGPVTVDLPAEIIDQRTGFHAGPGPVRLSGADTVAFLRSRTWEERRGDDWVMTGASDLDRLDHLHTYLAAAFEAAANLGAGDRIEIVLAAIRSGSIRVRDPLGLTGILMGARSIERIRFGTLPVKVERSVDERRSPFAPDDLEAGYRLVLDARALSTLDTCAGGTAA